MYHIQLNKRIGFGNTVSHSERKCRRKFSSNKKAIIFYSSLLSQNIKVDGGVKDMKTIYKYGGIDLYCIHYKNISSKFKNIRKIIVSCANKSY